MWEKHGRSIGNAWWWNEEAKEAVLLKKEVLNRMSQKCTVVNKRRYKGMKNQRKQF